MKFRVKYYKEGLFIAESDDGRVLVIDARDRETKKYFSPMELLLVASAGCTAVDVSDILRKMRKEFDELIVEIEGKRRGDYPKIYEEVSINYKVYGDDVSRENVEKAVKLSLDKYCSASITLKRAGARLNYNIEVS
jgi:putative redox protein